MPLYLLVSGASMEQKRTQRPDVHCSSWLADHEHVCRQIQEDRQEHRSSRQSPADLRLSSCVVFAQINLCDVLEVDTKRQIVRVEPLASMGQISATLLPLGWTLAVVPELDDLVIALFFIHRSIRSLRH